MRCREIILVGYLLIAPLAWSARADLYDPPANYYNAATGTGATLKQQLNDIIDNHTDIGYDGAKTALGVTDADPTNPNNLITVYDRTSISKVWDDSPLIWNREHTWPRSRGVGESGPDDSDLFALRPALTAGNGARQNFNFGGAFGQQPKGLITAPNPDMWYPGDADAGMIARQEFYMAVRYDGADSNTTNLELTNGNPAASQTTALLGEKDALIEWHFAAPPDEFERRRNHVIYTNYQHNRDPFIDHPEWVWSVFMATPNDSQITLAGGTTAADGTSSLNVNLGRRLVGNNVAVSMSPPILQKGGMNGTYARVTPTGEVGSPQAGPFNAFRTNTADSKALAITTTATTAGSKSGALVIDNLDITSGAGTGRGALDGNDTVSIQYTALEHANPSFAAASDSNSLLIDFGSVKPGVAAPSVNFSLNNLGAAPSLTAGLDFDSFSGSGHTGVLTTNLATFTGAATLVAGDARQFTASMSTAQRGVFSATYTLNFSDENLDGATSQGAMTLTLTGRVETADFDQNGEVNGADLLAWQRGFGKASGASLLEGDADGNLAVNATDLGVWRSQWGVPSGLASVPEPSGLLTAATALGAISTRRRRRSC